MGLLDLVEQHHRIGPPPDRFCELPAFLVADIARRGADQPRDRVPLLVLAHVDADHGPFVVEQELGQGAGQLGLPHSRRPQEDERADGAVRIRQPRPGPPYSVGHGGHGLVLVDHPLVQPLLHVDQLLDLALHEPGDRDARPLGHDLGDVLFVHLFLQHLLLGLE